eukprot:8871069-Pyramimonas_sp.AAC.1
MVPAIFTETFGVCSESGTVCFCGHPKLGAYVAFDKTQIFGRSVAAAFYSITLCLIMLCSMRMYCSVLLSTERRD